MAISRKRTATCLVGNVPIGGPNPIVVQSMTNTDTADSAATVNQVLALAQAGSELVRVTVNHDKAAEAVPLIVRTLRNFGCEVPIVGDFHYNGHILLRKYPDCARALAKYRINPGNVDIGKKHDENFRTMVEAAIDHGKPVRIGVNWGSLDQRLLTDQMNANARRTEPWSASEVIYETIVLSALRSAEAAESYGLGHDRIVLSAKVSNVQDLIAVYRNLASRCDYPMHLGLTEAGMGAKGIVASTAGISVLLQDGIGDTIRVSLTPSPDGDRCEEVEVAKQILQSLDLRDRMPEWKTRYEGVETMNVAVMGCVVNGPGESKHAQIGISLPGTFEEPVAPVYVDGRLLRTLRGEGIVAEFIDILNAYVASSYAPKGGAVAAV